MKKKLYVTLAGMAMLITGIVIISCQKNQNDENHLISESKTVTITEINDFVPLDEDIPVVYEEFLIHNEALENGYKSSIQDQQVDSALWRIETYLNTAYGFSNDSCYFLDETVDTVSFTIAGYGPSGVPIIDGDELTDFLDDIETEIAAENNDGNNEFFWCCIFEVDTIRASKVKTRMKRVRTISFYGVYPPGYDPTQFIHYTCMYAIHPGECDDKWWWGATEEYQRRYQTYSIWQGNDCIMVYRYNYGYQNGDPHFQGYDPFWEGTYEWETLSTDTDPEEDELNHYLQTTKNGIDMVNTQGNDNYYMGYVDIWWFQSQVDNKYKHYMICHYFEKVCGPAGNE